MRAPIQTATAACILLVLLVSVTVLFPAVLVIIGLISGMARGGLSVSDVVPDHLLLQRTAATALFIAACATVLAWPAAWAARNWPWQRLLILMIPMLLPSYLAYSGWGILRAPGTWLGDFLLAGPAGATSPVENWWPIAAARVQAVVGLVLWAWPLAAAILIARFRRVDEATLEALRLEPVGRIRRAWTIFSMLKGGTLAALGLVTLVMLGSAIPLHVAQFETYAIFIWRRMTETGAGEQWRVWVAAWPLLAVAIAGAVVMTRRIATVDQGFAARPSRQGAGVGRVVGPLFTAVLLALSVVVPAVLFTTTLRSTRPLVRFWDFSWQPLLGSTGIAAAVGVVAFIMIICAWMACGGSARGGWTRRVTLMLGGILLTAGLAPGMLIGAATSRAWTWLGGLSPAARDIADSPVILVVAHLGRFGFLAVLAGVLLAATEPRNMRDLRLIDAGPTLRGFLRAALPPQLGVIIATAVAVALLSFHEIEAAVLLQPPSAVGGGLPWQMLQWLHFARMEDLSAAVLWVLGIAAVILGVIGVVAAVSSRIGRRRLRAQ